MKYVVCMVVSGIFYSVGLHLMTASPEKGLLNFLGFLLIAAGGSVAWEGIRG